MEYFSIDQASNRENNDAEDMIDEEKDRTMNDEDDDVRVAAFVDSENMQGEAGTNDNDHEDSVVDDTILLPSNL